MKRNGMIKSIFALLMVCMLAGCGNASSDNQEMTLDNTSASSVSVEEVAQEESSVENLLDEDTEVFVANSDDVEESESVTIESWLNNELTTNAIVYDKDGVLIQLEGWHVDEEGNAIATLSIQNDNPENKRFSITNNNNDASNHVVMSFNGISIGGVSYTIAHRVEGEHKDDREIISGEKRTMELKIRNDNLDSFFISTKTDITTQPLQWYDLRLNVKLGSDGKDEVIESIFYTKDYNESVFTDNVYYGNKIGSAVLDGEEVDVYCREETDAIYLTLLVDSDNGVSVDGVNLFVKDEYLENESVVGIKQLRKNYAKAMKIKTIDEIRRDHEIGNDEPIYLLINKKTVLCELTGYAQSGSEDIGRSYSEDEAKKMFTNYLIEVLVEPNFDVTVSYKDGYYFFEGYHQGGGTAGTGKMDAITGLGTSFVFGEEVDVDYRKYE